MSLTLLYRGKNVRFSLSLNKLHWLSALTAFALVSGGIVYLLLSSNAIPLNSSNHQPSYFTQIQDDVLSSLNEKNTPQVIALTTKLAELQSQALRLNALGERLAENANIPAKEFNLNQLPPAGGPMVDSELSGKSIEQLTLEILQLNRKFDHEEKQLSMLESLLLGHHIVESSYLSGKPISKGWLSSYYGVRKDPFTGRATMHKGIDFAGKENSDVIATGAGVISWAGKRFGYGQLIEINHGNGIKTRYGHNKTILVSVGDVVAKGQSIAKMGSTGRSTGPHVHYEILRNDKQIDPTKYVYRKAK